MKPFVEFRISNLGGRTSSTMDAIPFATIDGDNVVIRCPQNSGETINDMIVWLWGLLNHKRRILKTLQASGANLTCICKVPRGQVILSPNASEFLHLTGTTLLLTAVAA